MEKNKNLILKAILWIVQGCIVGIGAILPGVSGGTLCYAFGIYDQILEVLSSPLKGLKKHWRMLIFVFLGVAIGFVCFAGVMDWLLGLNQSVVFCVFVGLIIGTLPELWKDAGKQGRTKFSILSLLISFVAVSAVFYIFANVWKLTVPANTFGWLICGLFWGLGFIVPGLSSSTLLIFFGIYEKMSEGIARLDFGVLIPLGLAVLATFLLLSKLMKLVFDKFYSTVSHCIIGFVIATTLMILPSFSTSIGNIIIYIISIVCGAIASFFFNIFCARIRAKTGE